MLQNYADKYANMLNGRDVSILFEHLKRITNRSEAARICELERRTTFYWKENKEIKLQTKKQVLEALLEKDYLFTLNYLCEKSFEISNETIDLYLKSIYENAMIAETDVNRFTELLKAFFETRIKYAPLISANLKDVIYNLTLNLEEQASSLGVEIPKIPLSTMSAEDVMANLPFLMRELPNQISEDGLNQIIQQFRVPLDLIKFAFDIRTEMCTLGSSQMIFAENTAPNPYSSPLIPMSATGTNLILERMGIQNGGSSDQKITSAEMLAYIK